MKRTLTYVILPVAVLVGLVAVAVTMFPADESAEAANGPPNRVVVLHGTAALVMRNIDGIDQPCFDVDLVDPKTDKVIGTATDCLDLGSIASIGDDGGFGINNTTFFDFPEGTVVSFSRTTIQPAESGGFVFITGEVADGDNILPDMGTGRFSGVTGATRLSGIVDMSEFFAGSGDTISFDCIFVIDFS